MAEVTEKVKVVEYTIILSEEEHQALTKLCGNLDVKTALSKKLLDTESEFNLIYNMFFDLQIFDIQGDK